MDGPQHCFPIRPSRSLLVVRAGAHALALVACCWSGLYPLGPLLALPVALSLLRECLTHGRGEALLLGTGRGGWWIEERGRRSPVGILGGSAVWPALVVLQLRVDDGVRWLVLAPDSASTADFRRLRVALRLGEPGSGREDRIEGLR
jgi:hypothetical protein